MAPLPSQPHRPRMARAALAAELDQFEADCEQRLKEFLEDASRCALPRCSLGMYSHASWAAQVAPNLFHVLVHNCRLFDISWFGPIFLNRLVCCSSHLQYRLTPPPRGENVQEFGRRGGRGEALGPRAGSGDTGE